MPVLPQQHKKLALRIKLADPLVLAELGDEVVAVVILHDIADVAELTGSGARRAAELAQFDAFGRVNAKAVIVRIADDQVAVAVDAEAAGPAIAIVRRRPGGAEVMAVAVVDLNARGEIDNVEAIPRIDGDGTGTDHVSVLHAAQPQTSSGRDGSSPQPRSRSGARRRPSRLIPARSDRKGFLADAVG